MNLESLDQPCLEKIARYLDCGSFHSLLLTCKRFLSLLGSPLSWNNSILYRKTLYMIHRCIFSPDDMEESEGVSCQRQLLRSVSKVLTKALDCCRMLESIAPTKVTHTWDSCGPVFGKIHSLVNWYEEREKTFDPDDTTEMKQVFIKFSLPSGKDLELLYSHFRDLSWNLSEEEAVRVVINKVGVVYYNEGNVDECIKSSSYWNHKTRSDNGRVTQSNDLDCLNPLGKLLEEEIGETEQQGIDGHFLKWFAVGFPSFPYSFDPYTLSDGEVITFKNKDLNKLNEDTVKAQYLEKKPRVINDFRHDIKINSDAGSVSQVEYSHEATENKTESNFSTLAFNQQHDNASESADTIKVSTKSTADFAFRELSELILILTAREDLDRLNGLNTAFLRFKDMDLIFSSNKNSSAVTASLFRLLLLRVNFCRFSKHETWGTRWMEKVGCELEFKLCGSHLLNVKAESSAYGLRDPSYYGQSLEFHIPTLDVHVRYEFGKGEPEKLSGNLSCLSTVTEEIQLCIENGVPEACKIKITNEFVVGFFISLSEIDYTVPFRCLGMTDKSYLMIPIASTKDDKR